MKPCPKCGHPNDDDSGFCVIDGAPLGEAHRVVVSLEEPEPEVQTRWVPKPSVEQPVPVGKTNPGLIYGLLGGLIAAVLLMGAYIFFLAGNGRDANANSSKASNNDASPGSNAVVTSNMPNSGANKPIGNTMANASNAMVPAANMPANTVGNSQFMPQGPDTAHRFNRTYSGTVGDNGVSMQLRRDGTYLGGRIIPNGRYAEIYVEGYVERDGTFSMDEKSDLGLMTGVYHGRLNADGTMTGTWSKPGGDKTRLMFLRRH